MTIISTIGYGTFAPVTAAGRIFTMVFAILSIAYFGYFLTITSDRLIFCIKWFAQKWKGDKSFVLKPTAELRVTIVLAILYIFFLSACGPIFAGWNFGDSFYFAIITFTTIGLGDYAPAFNPERSATFRS